MPRGIQQPIRIQTPSTGFLGLDTASEPTSIDLARSRRLYNAYQGKLKALTKRPGSAPVTETALADPIKTLTAYPFGTPKLMATSGTSLYEYDGTDFVSATMTNNLNSADAYMVYYTAVNSSGIFNIALIGDDGILKQYDGTEVKDVVPAADGPSPDPANILTDINGLGCKFIWVHSGYVFIAKGHEMFYSKQALQSGSDNKFDYFPETHYLVAIRDGDYINGNGIPFDNVCFVPMRHGWCVLQGTNFNDFNSGEFLNTLDGLIAPRSATIVTYADGSQTIAYLSDTGVSEIFTTILDNRGKQYATRNLMTNKLDWRAYGFTESEMAAAVAQYVPSYNMYLLEIDRDGTPYVFGYDTRNAEWYMWTGLQINALLEYGGTVYFAGDDGHLKTFDAELTDDWTDFERTTGTPVDLDRISGMIWFENTGYDSTLDYYILRLKTYAVVASLDVSIVYMQGIAEIQEAIQNSYLVWDVSEWDVAAWANLDYTDLVSSPQRLSTRLRLPKKGFYFQVRWRNNRSEPCEIYGETFIGRSSGEV